MACAACAAAQRPAPESDRQRVGSGPVVCVCMCWGVVVGGGQVLGAALAVGRRIFRLRGTLLDEITDYIGANARDRSNMRNGHVR